MLVELNITNYAVIDRLSIRLGPGFNVLTGETGAGKSIILDALGLLLGDKPDAGAIRAGAEQAYVEGIFELSAETAAAMAEMLELDVANDGLIVAREISASGRSVCRINGRAFPQRRLSEVGMGLVDVHGQSEHLSLLRPGEHVDLLDRYAGLTELRSRYAGVVRSLTRTLKELQALEQEAAGTSERKELLTFQAQEISSAGLQPGEEEALLGERSLRVNALRIHELAGLARAALDSESATEPGGIELVRQAVAALGMLERIDPGMAEARQTAEAAALQLEELVRDIRSYADGVEFDQQRLADIEDRLNLISSLKRKYGAGIPEILEFENSANQELARLEGRGSSAEELSERLDSFREHAADLAAELSTARRRAAIDLTKAVEGQLAGLGMQGARLGVEFVLVAHPGGLHLGGVGLPASCVVVSGVSKPSPDAAAGRLRYDLTGVDRIEFVISPNPGEPLRPLASIASGGETSRLMLAIKGVLSQADAIPILVFDEVDAGIGGSVGEAVGRRLWSLGRHHQVVAVTHLPQIAAFGDRHLSVRKIVRDGRTTTQVVEVQEGSRVEELTQMLGSDTPATRRKAAELLTETKKVVADQRSG